jgi:heptosyltransferase-1
MRVLVVKTSSLGDIIHTLPALTDAKRARPEIVFDWVVEEAFQEIPMWHMAVDRIIPVALRRWRRNKWKAFRSGEIRNFLKQIRQQKYDYVIDAQGLLKSVAVTMLSRGALRAGFSWKSAREPLASLFYQKRVVVPWEQHAVVRARALLAKALDYVVPTTVADYGIERSRLAVAKLQHPYFVFLHGTTWDTKHWPETYWIELAKIVARAGYAIQLLWGNEVELARAKKIASIVSQAVVVPNKLKLSEVAGVLANAQGIVTVDTGLGHLAAALGVSTVSLYGPTDPKRSGTWGERQIHLAADFCCAPCFSRVCTYKGDKITDPPCFASLTPAIVWQHLVPPQGDV